MDLLGAEALVKPSGFSLHSGRDMDLFGDETLVDALGVFNPF